MAIGWGSGSATYDGPASVVYDQVNVAQAYANSAFNQATSFLDSLSNFTASVAPINASGFFNDITTPSANFVIPATPDEPILNPVVVSVPSFTPFPVNSNFDDVGPAPEFTTADPILNLPSAPPALGVTAPGDAPNITTVFEYPDAPTDAETALPPVPTLQDLDLPSAPDIVIPTFDELLPDVSSVGAPPSNTFNFSEVFYTDDLLTQTSVELLDRITNGGTGINATVEQAIFDRARNREDINSLRSSEQLIRDQAARGFNRPTGAMLAGLDYLAQETQGKIADLSREITIKQAELEQSNLQFALQTSVQLEGQLLSFASQVQQRAFDTERVTVELAIEIYKSRLAQFEIELETYKAAAAVFEAEVSAELARIEIYKTEIEAQGLINDLNDTNVKIYLAQLQGVNTVVEIYKTEIEAVNSRVRSEAIKLDLYKTEVEAYGVQVGAKRDEFSIYAEQVKAELAKVTVFEAQAKAFAARIGAYATEIDAEAKKVDASVESSQAHTSGYLATVDGIIKQAQANQLQVTSSVDIFRGQATMYTAQVGAEEARVDAESKTFELEVREATAKADIALKNADIAVTNADNIATLQLEAMKAGAIVASQLAASSLSALNIGASISGSSSDVHNYQEK